MSEKLEALWAVSRNDVVRWIFRSRDDAIRYVRQRKSRATTTYRVTRVTWGPEGVG